MIYWTKFSEKNYVGFTLNFLTFLVIISIGIFIALGTKQMSAPLDILQSEPITLDYRLRDDGIGRHYGTIFA